MFYNCLKRQLNLGLFVKMSPAADLTLESCLYGLWLDSSESKSQLRILLGIISGSIVNAR
jgi:hypothetical protein